MRLEVSPLYKYREIGGEHYLIPVGEAAVKRKDPLQLTDTAAFLWKLLKEGRDEKEAADALTEEFEVDRAGAAEAVDGFIRALLAGEMAFEKGREA